VATRPLRIGVFAAGRLQPRWLVEAFADATASGVAAIAVIAHGRASRQELERASPIWQIYEQADRRLFGQGADPQQPMDLLLELSHAERVELPLLDADRPAWRARVQALALDVAFALGEFDDRLLDGLASHGVWRYWVGDGMEHACARAVAEGLELTPTGLKLRAAAGAPERVFYRSCAATHAFSISRNRDAVLRKSSRFVERALRELDRLRGAPGAWEAHCEQLEIAPPAAAAASQAAPRAADLRRDLWDVSRLGARVALRSAQKLISVDQWSLAFRFNSDRFGGNDTDGPFTRILPPRDRLWADPFPVQVAGRSFVFFEDMPFATGKGHISVIEVRPDGSHSAPQKVLERDYHLSYPFLLEHEGALFMIPESAQNRTVEMYRCVTFPDRWRLERVLMRKARVADATLHRAADRWWMFANMAGEGAGLDDELHLFHAPRLDAPWQPHPANPVKSDVRSARPAGRLFTRQGELFRPAQVGVPLYGSAISINRVLRLTPTEYQEREVRRMEPARGEGLLGIHTYNEAGELAVIDGFARRLRAVA
jgi:hypothetical protein